MRIHPIIPSPFVPYPLSLQILVPLPFSLQGEKVRVRGRQRGGTLRHMEGDFGRGGVLAAPPGPWIRSSLLGGNYGFGTSSLLLRGC